MKMNSDKHERVNRLETLKEIIKRVIERGDKMRDDKTRITRLTSVIKNNERVITSFITT